MTTKLLDTLTLAEGALENAKWFDNQYWIERAEKALAAIREQKVELEKQEPVASVSLWHNHGYQNRQLEYYGNLPDGLHQLYAAPVQQAEQEPVAEIIGFTLVTDMRGTKRIPNIQWNVPLWDDESPLTVGKLYAAPVSIEAAVLAERDKAMEAARTVGGEFYTEFKKEYLG